MSHLLTARPSLLPAESVQAELAHHAFAAGDLPRALTASLAAAQAAAQAGAQPERLRHLERVVQLWDKTSHGAATPIDRLTVLEEIVDASYHGAAVRRGIEAADQALESIDATRAPARAALLHYQRAHLRNQSGTGGQEDLRRALDLLPEQPPTLLRGEVLAELAVTLAFTGDSAGARRHAESALAVAEQLDATALAAKAHSYLGLAEPDPAVAIDHFARAHEAAATAHDAATLLTVVTWESAALVAAGHFAAAIDTIHSGLRIAHDTFRFTERGPILLVKWAQVLTALGRWTEATQLIDETLAEPLPALGTAALHLCHARIAIARGDFQVAELDADTAERNLGAGRWAGQYRLELGGIRARLALARAETQQAAQHLTATLATGEPTEYPHDIWPLLVLSAQLPDLPIDHAALAAALPWTSVVDAAHRAVYTATISGTVSDWQAAVAAWQLIPQPYEQAQALLGCATAELATGDRIAARAALLAAATRAAELGAAPLLETIRRTAERARLPLDTPADDDLSRATPAAPRTFGLTPRELDVLRLVAQGSSNRQLAAELFISANTAGVHVSRILTKLGVATRTEAAAFAHRHRLLTEPG
ncbi:LuxR C-terminal-related transcriptional regulator [Nocardia sp. NPDC050710]|uniref:LuxR C-terminal-related transcriptional regulator n=1 Tax=Nocardia sp. NPDC050710 TaxID=3157220 RepID=UPI0033CA9A8C